MQYVYMILYLYMHVQGNMSEYILNIFKYIMDNYIWCIAAIICTIVVQLFNCSDVFLATYRQDIYIYILVGGLEHFLFSHILGIIMPID